MLLKNNLKPWNKRYKNVCISLPRNSSSVILFFLNDPKIGMNFSSHTQGEKRILIFYNVTQLLTLNPISLMVLESLISVTGVFLNTSSYKRFRIIHNAEALWVWEEMHVQLSMAPPSRCLGAQPLCCFCVMCRAKRLLMKLRTCFAWFHTVHNPS